MEHITTTAGIMTDKRTLQGFAKVIALLIVGSWLISAFSDLDRGVCFILATVAYFSSALLYTIRAKFVAERLDFEELELELAEANEAYNELGTEAQEANQILLQKLEEAENRLLSVEKDKKEMKAKLETNHRMLVEIKSKYQEANSEIERLELAQNRHEEAQKATTDKIQEQEKANRILKEALKMSEEKSQGLQHRCQNLSALEPKIEELKAKNKSLIGKLGRYTQMIESNNG